MQLGLLASMSSFFCCSYASWSLASWLSCEMVYQKGGRSRISDYWLIRQWIQVKLSFPLPFLTLWRALPSIDKWMANKSSWPGGSTCWCTVNMKSYQITMLSTYPLADFLFHWPSLPLVIISDYIKVICLPICCILFDLTLYILSLKLYLVILLGTWGSFAVKTRVISSLSSVSVKLSCLLCCNVSEKGPIQRTSRRIRHQCLPFYQHVMKLLVPDLTAW